jgi:hypothetical protein
VRPYRHRDRCHRAISRPSRCGVDRAAITSPSRRRPSRARRRGNIRSRNTTAGDLIAGNAPPDVATIRAVLDKRSTLCLCKPRRRHLSRNGANVAPGGGRNCLLDRWSAQSSMKVAALSWCKALSFLAERHPYCAERWTKRRPISASVLALPLLSLCGCSEVGAPALDIFGAFFSGVAPLRRAWHFRRSRRAHLFCRP